MRFSLGRSGPPRPLLGIALWRKGRIWARAALQLTLAFPVMTKAQIVVVSANPNGSIITDVDFDYIRRFFGADRATWLDRGFSCEFEVDGITQDMDQAHEEFRDRGLDVAVLPSANRRKRLLVADMDSTVIEQECIDELAAEAGVGEAVSAITEQAMNGVIDFEDAVRERVALLAGLPEETIEKVWRERVTLTPGAETLVGTMSSAGARTVLISGGFKDFTGRVAERLGFHEHYANELLRADGKLTGEVGTPILGRDAKRRILTELLDRHGLKPEDVMAVGDAANDLAMIQLAGCGVAFRAKPLVAALSDARVDFCDLSALLHLQGFHRDEFVGSSDRSDPSPA